MIYFLFEFKINKKKQKYQSLTLLGKWMTFVDKCSSINKHEIYRV